MYSYGSAGGDGFFDSLCSALTQIGSSLIYICLAFMLVAIGLFFIAKFRKTNKEFKDLKCQKIVIEKVEPEVKE